MTVRWRRGFLRLWLIATVLWQIPVLLLFIPPSYQEWRRQTSVEAELARDQISVLCGRVEGILDPLQCEIAIREAINAGEISFRPRPVTEVRQQTVSAVAFSLGVGFGLPLIVLGFGFAVGWAVRGFQGSSH